MKIKDREPEKETDSAEASLNSVLRDMEELEKMRWTMSRSAIKATPEFKRFVRSLCGRFAYLGQTVDDFLREKREEVEREDR